MTHARTRGARLLAAKLRISRALAARIEEPVPAGRTFRTPKLAYQWPSWVCGALDARKGDVCGLEASWMQHPTARASTPWLYCARHRPAGAVRIPADLPFTVTRLELRVAASGAPGDRLASADEAVSRIQGAIEAAGGLIVGLRVLGGTASRTGASGPPLRLQLAGRRELPAADSPLWQAPSGPPPWIRWRKRRAG